MNFTLATEIARKRASTYLGIVVLVLAVMNRQTAILLTPLAVFMFVYGSVVTAIGSKESAEARAGAPVPASEMYLFRPASVFTHFMIAFVCMRHGTLTTEGVLLACTVCSGILFVYYLLGMWPYALDVVPSVVFGMSMFTAMLFLVHRR